MHYILALLLFVLTLLPTSAGATGHALRAVATWAGLPTDVAIHSLNAEPADIDGGFIAAGTHCSWFFCQTVPTIILMWTGSEVPYGVKLGVLLHEIGHYHQWKTETFDSLGVVEREWAADAYAVRALCQLGLDGPAVTLSSFRWVYVTKGYKGDKDHGTLADRMDAADRVGCRGVSQEAA